MNTEEIMNLALELAVLQEIPEDSAIYVKGNNIKKVLFGLDIGVAELMFAKQQNYDAVIAHHPAGETAIINHYNVFRRHVDQMTKAGISKEEAEKAIQKKLGDLETDAHSRNCAQVPDMARLLKMPFMNIHTPLDEIGRRTMSEQINRKIKKDAAVQDVVSALNELPEFKNATTKIKIRIGKPENPAGKVVVSHGAGTNGGYEIAKTYFKHGVGTIIYIHIGLGDLEKLRADGVGNLIITGHIASDSVGINPFIKELQNRNITVTTLGIVPS
jgi:putative NIF3 family GTP cyclohydrolase 1 type 2